MRRFLQLCALFIEYLAVSIKQNLKNLPNDKKTILFKLNDDRLYLEGDGNGRYAYLTLNIFCEGGYNVYLYKKMNFHVFVNLGKYGRFIYSIDNLKIINKIPEQTNNIIYAFDSHDNEAVNRQWKKKIYVNILKSPTYYFGEWVWIPYYFHPMIYRNKQNKAVQTFRSNERKLRIFFGGNLSKYYYRNSDLRTYYNQMNRLEGINAITELNSKIVMFKDARQFQNQFHDGIEENKCTILQTDHTFPIKPVDWLKIISMSKFFLCLSGTDLPMCHHSIEAMAVGTIPIIAYPDWFFPKLQHRKNAILYTDKEDLIEKMNEVFNMSEDEIKIMRQNVIEYYEKNLTAKSFIERFEQHGESIDTIMLHPKLKCAERDAQEGKKLFGKITQHSDCYV